MGIAEVYRFAVPLVEKQQGILNVKSFGAKGDGAANDSPAIQAALDAAAAAGGGAVYLPAGTYSIGAGLTVGDKTTLYGVGRASIIRYTVNAYAAIRNTNGDNANGNTGITIRDLAIDLNGTGKNGIMFGGVDRGTIHNVRVSSSAGYGIWLVRPGDSVSGEGKPTKFVTVSDCHVTGVVDIGIEYSGSISCTTVGCTVTGTTGNAYYAWNGAQDCVFSGNVAEGEGSNPQFRAFAVQPADLVTNPAPSKTQTQRITFVGNVARNVWKGVWITGATNNKPTDILFENNSISGQNVTDVGIDIAYSDRVAVSGNQVAGFHWALWVSEPGAPFDSAQYINIDGNRFVGGVESHIYGVTGGSFCRNSITGTSNHSVRMYAVRNCAISNNVFFNIGATAAAVCMTIGKNGTTESTGNVFTGNKAHDDRGTKYTSHLVYLQDAADYNLAMGNSAYGAAAGASGYINTGTGLNNVAANNING